MAPPPPPAVGDGEGEGDRPPFRWLDVARYAAASTVTVLIIIVVLKAIKVVLVPDLLYVSVVRGSIDLTSSTMGIQKDPTLFFYVNLRIDNARHAWIHYRDVIAYLFDNDTPASSSNPDNASLVYYNQSDLDLHELVEVYYSVQVMATRQVFDPEFFDLLYHNESASMSGVTMRLDGILVTETFGLNTSRPVTYYCWPLIVRRSFGGSWEDQGDEDDVFCRDAQRSHFI